MVVVMVTCQQSQCQVQRSGHLIRRSSGAQSPEVEAGVMELPECIGRCRFYGKPTTVSLLQLFEGDRLCVDRRCQHRFSASTSFRSRTFSTAVVCRHAGRFDSFIEFHCCLLSRSASFSLNRNTLSNRILCMRVRQLDARLFRHGRKCTLSIQLRRNE